MRKTAAVKILMGTDGKSVSYVGVTSISLFIFWGKRLKIFLNREKFDRKIKHVTKVPTV